MKTNGQKILYSFLIILLSVLPGLVSAQGYYDNEDSEDYDFYLARVTTNLNLRDGPSASSAVLARIPKGEFVV